MEVKENLPQKLMVLIALIQGLCLLFLHQAIEIGFWPNHQPQWLFALYSVAFIWPIMLLLSLKPGNSATVVKYTAPFALLSAVLGYYVGSQATPIEHVRYDSLLFGYIFTMLIATFKALMYSQQMASGDGLNYSSLFRWSWRNFLTVALALLFAGSFWMILMLWGALFNAIGIRFFRDLFQDPWFYYPAIALANGFGVVIFRRMTHIIDTITRLQQALMKFLLVVLVLVSILFLFALPFTGLDPLWESGGSALILWMQALMLFFVNAVYQDHPDQRPYSLWLHRFIYFGIALLPIYSAISFYGLSLRVDQYGWSIDRCWAFLVWFLLALFPLGYWWGIAKRRDNWLVQLNSVNVVVGLVVLAAMLLINSPLLDFRKIVASDQLERIVDNKIDIDTLDVYYFRSKLARPGYEALMKIKEEYGETHPALVLRIDQSYQNHRSSEPASKKEDFLAALKVLSGQPSQTLLTAIYEQESKSSWKLRDTRQFYLRPVDLNQDGKEDYLLVARRLNYIDVKVYYYKDEHWQSKYLSASQLIHGDQQQDFIDALTSGEIILKQPEWQILEISGAEFRVQD